MRINKGRDETKGFDSWRFMIRQRRRLPPPPPTLPGWRMRPAQEQRQQRRKSPARPLLFRVWLSPLIHPQLQFTLPQPGPNRCRGLAAGAAAETHCGRASQTAGGSSSPKSPQYPARDSAHQILRSFVPFSQPF